jgi:hypothetical protein
MEQTRETQDKDVLLILTQCTYQSSKHKVTEEVHYQISRRISQVATTAIEGAIERWGRFRCTGFWYGHFVLECACLANGQGVGLLFHYLLLSTQQYEHRACVSCLVMEILARHLHALCVFSPVLFRSVLLELDVIVVTMIGEIDDHVEGKIPGLAIALREQLLRQPQAFCQRTSSP